MSLSRAAIEGVLISHGMSYDEINRALAPSPQIIRNAQELEALDPDTLLINRDEDEGVLTARDLLSCGKIYRAEWLPAVKVAEGAHVRACREAPERDA
ncbi:hypothetical protein [Corynebacterium kalidii]